MEQSFQDRDKYLEIVRKFYRDNSISVEFLFDFYKEGGGTVESVRDFYQALQTWCGGNVKEIVQSVFKKKDKKFKTIIITKDNKFIEII